MATIKQRIDNVTESVTDGKSGIANAIIEKGVYTANNDTFSTMANNIKKLPSIFIIKTILNNANKINAPCTLINTTSKTINYQINEFNHYGDEINSKGGTLGYNGSSIMSSSFTIKGETCSFNVNTEYSNTCKAYYHYTGTWNGGDDVGQNVEMYGEAISRNGTITIGNQYTTISDLKIIIVYY